MLSEDFEQAQYLSSQVEQARQRAVLAASDAGASRDDARSAEFAAREHAKKAGTVVTGVEQARDEAQAAADRAEAPTDSMVAELAGNPVSLTRAAVDQATGDMISTGGSTTQAAGDARWVTQTGADILVASEIERTGSETQVSGDNRWVTKLGADSTVAEVLSSGEASTAAVASITNPLYVSRQMASYNNVYVGKDALANLPSDWNVRNNNGFGIGALFSLRKGVYNDFFGLNAGYYLDGTGTTGMEATRNSGFGSNTQRFNRTGYNNSSMGRNSLQCNVAGSNNVALGPGSMAGLAPLGLDGIIKNGTPVNPNRNVGVGVSTLDLTGGDDNTAIGYGAGKSIKLAYGNTLVGSGAGGKIEETVGWNGKSQTNPSLSGTYSISGTFITFVFTAHGVDVGDTLRVGIEGQESQWFVAKTVPNGDTITCDIGYSPSSELSGSATLLSVLDASVTSTLSTFNTALGFNSLQNLNQPNSQGNTALGFAAGSVMVDGSDATFVRNCVMLGRNASVSGDAQVQLGNSGMTVYAQQAIQLRSDGRDKADVRPTVLGLDFIKKLRPVDYRWDVRSDYFEFDDSGNIKGELPRNGSKKRSRYHQGFIAQEVREVMDELGVEFGGFQDHKFNGGNDVLSIGYEEFIAPAIRAIQQINERLEILEGGSEGGL